jgi:hypothetical protein
MHAPRSYTKSIRVVVNTRHTGGTLESTQTRLDQLSKAQPCLANVHSAAENTACLVHMRGICELPTQV